MLKEGFNRKPITKELKGDAASRSEVRSSALSIVMSQRPKSKRLSSF